MCRNGWCAIAFCVQGLPRPIDLTAAARRAAQPAELATMATMKQLMAPNNRLTGLPAEASQCPSMPVNRAWVCQPRGEGRRCSRLPTPRSTRGCQILAAGSGWKQCELINVAGNRITELPPMDGLPKLKKLLLSGVCAQAHAHTRTHAHVCPRAPDSLALRFPLPCASVLLAPHERAALRPATAPGVRPGWCAC